MPSATLVISGSLSESSVIRFLSSPDARGAVVIEFDTSLERSLFPGVSVWMDYCSFIATWQQAQALDDQSRELLAQLLDPCPGSGELPGDGDLRRAALRARDWQVALPQMLTDLIFEQVRSQHDISRIIVAAGAGVSFEGWRSTASAAGLPVEFLPVEKCRMSLRRRLERWRARWRRKRRHAETKPASPISSDEGVSPDVLCCSERINSMLTGHAEEPPFSLRYETTENLGEPVERELSTWREHFEIWWHRWRECKIEGAAAASPCVKFQDVLLRLGDSYVSGRYARFAALRERAQQVLMKARPRLLLSDTQTDTDDRAWSLAARSLGIPVASYTYDHVVDAKLSFVPDHLIADGACNREAAIRFGYPPDNIVSVQGHRLPTCRSREASGVCSFLKAARPKVLFADSYHAAWSAHSEPGMWMRQYRQIVEAARRTPQADFFIKPHPLRTKKQEMLAFAGMDEQELHVRKRQLQRLAPPSNLRMLPPEDSMDEHLQSSAILLNTTSTTGLQAFHLGVPVVFLMPASALFYSFPQLHTFTEVMCVTEDAELTSRIHRLLSEADFALELVHQQRRYLDGCFWPVGSQTLAQGIQAILSRLDTASQTGSTGTPAAGPNF